MAAKEHRKGIIRGYSRTLEDLPVMERDDWFRKLQEAEQLEKEVKRRYYVSDLLAFNREVLHVEAGTVEGKEKVSLAPAHRELCEFVQYSSRKRKLILMPRGHLKSTLVTVGYSLQRIARDNTVRILIMNATYPMACTFLGQIKKHLQFNETFREIFGKMDENASKWRDDMVTVPKLGVGASYREREPTVTAWGVGGSLVSQHYDLIIADDIVVRENIGTKEQIDKVITTFKDILDLLEPHGDVIVIGTRWHDADLYGHILDSRNDLLDSFDILTMKAVSNSDLERGQVLFPQKYSREYLKQLKREKGTSEFSAQYLNDPVPPETAVFKRSMFRYYLTDDIAGKVLNRFVFIDPAVSEKKTADYTAIMTIGMDQYRNVFILDIFRERVPPSVLIKKLFEIDEVWHPVGIYVEAVANQKVLRPFIEQEMKNRGRFLPLREVKPGFGESKEMRIRGLESWYERGQIFHREGLANMDELEDELTRFPRGKHDDLVDALSYFPESVYPAKKNYQEEDRQAQKYLY